jgi:FlaA1/EpsC-like NDP-sugar epimerase
LGGGPNGEAGASRHSVSVLASRIRADIAFAALDVMVVIASYSVGLAFRMLDSLVVDIRGYWLDLLIVMPLIVTLHIVANALTGAYGHVWEHASTNEAARVVVANAGAVIAVFAVGQWLRTIHVVVPYSVILVGGLLSVLMMGLIRFRSRLFSFRKYGDLSRILVVGVGADGAAFARRAYELDGGGRVIGFLSSGIDEPETVRLFAGLPILGRLSDIDQVIEKFDIDHVVIAGGSLKTAREVVDRCFDIDVKLRILPAASEIMNNHQAPLDVRDIRVEDLLVRSPVATDMSEVAAMIKGKRVLVTGGGGSIGSEIVSQVLDYEPDGVWALDRDETLLHEAQLRWRGGAQSVLGDIRDATTLLRTFEMIRPQVVFHAAALKHVPVLEEYPEEAVMANVVGTRNVIEAGSRTGMRHFVLISTDKAVDPTSVMGASKRVAELMVRVAGERRDDCTYSAVRFGNVLGSRGSVIPTFVSQIQAGGPVTVTDPQMTRYFMTVDEAVQLVLQAGAIAEGSEVFLLDMGEPVRIEALARRLIRLSGLTPDKDIEILYTGRRPGEKLNEILSSGPMDTTDHPKIFEVKLDHPAAAVVASAVSDLEAAAESGDTGKVIELLTLLAGGHLNGGTAIDETGTRLTSSWS